MAARYRFCGEIRHDPRSLERLFCTQCRVYGKRGQLLWLGLGFGLVVLALVSGAPMWGKGLLLLLGCWMLASRDFPAVMRADRTLQERQGALPCQRCEFYEGDFLLSGEGSMRIPYKKLTRLVEDAEYLYLFLAENSLCMVERSGVEPEGDAALMEFLSEKTGLAWQREKSLLSLNLWDLFQSGRREKGGKPR